MMGVIAFDPHTVWCLQVTMWHKSTLNASKFGASLKNIHETTPNAPGAALALIVSSFANVYLKTRNNERRSGNVQEGTEKHESCGRDGRFDDRGARERVGLAQCQTTVR